VVKLDDRTEAAMLNSSSSVRRSSDLRSTVALPLTGALALALLCAAPARAQEPPCTPNFSIANIQGSDVGSLWQSYYVTTSGVVTALRGGSGAGFFIQMPVGDGDPSTSDGIFVAANPVPAGVVPGAAVCVEAMVDEAYPLMDFAGRSTTRLQPFRVVVQATGQPLPAAVTLTAADFAPGASIDTLERYEGMRVRVASLTVVAPTAGTVDETAASSFSTGAFYGVVAGTARPFREAGVELDVNDPLPYDVAPGVPRFDANPERLRIDSAALGLAPLDVAAGATLSNVSGIFEQTGHTNSVLLESAPGVTASTATAAGAAAPQPRSTEFTVASLNADRLFDTTDSPNHDDAVPTSAALARRLAKLSLYVRNVLRSPDLVAVEEVETAALLQSLAGKINADAVAAGQPDPGYQAYLIEGQDPTGLDVGLLARSRVTVSQVVQEGRDQTFVDPDSGDTAILNDRPPLVVKASVGLASGPVPVTVVVTHLESLSNVPDFAFGPKARVKRAAQAEFLAGMIQDRVAASPNEALVVLGDFQAYGVNDGYVDVFGTVVGSPADPAAVTVPTTDLVDPNLTDALAGLATTTRYTVLEHGNAAELHHVLVNDAASALQSRAWIAHANADFPDALRNDATRAERAAASDSPVVYFEVAAPEPAPAPTPVGPADITAKVKVKVWRSFYFWHYRGYTYALVDVTNLTTKALTGPFYLGIGGLPAGAQVVNARATLGGQPAVPVFWWQQLRPFRTMRAWIVLKGVPTNVTPTIRVYAGKLPGAK